jgi:hypothetical protein
VSHERSKKRSHTEPTENPNSEKRERAITDFTDSTDKIGRRRELGLKPEDAETG